MSDKQAQAQSQAALADRFRRLLSGGDRRSLAEAAAVLREARGNPRGIAALAQLADDPDWLVALRAVDTLEKLAHEQPGLVEPHKGVFLGPAADSDSWEMRLQVVRALPLFAWSPQQRARAVAVLLRDVGHPKLFVKAWAATSLARFAEQDPTLQPRLEEVLKAFEQSDSKALRTRARQIRAAQRG
jgi:HEAT repeat protein